MKFWTTSTRDVPPRRGFTAGLGFGFLSCVSLALVSSCLLSGCRTSVINIEDRGERLIPADSASETESNSDHQISFLHTYLEAEIIGFDGVDILIAVDNSRTMLQAQRRLAAEIYALLSSLFFPDANTPPIDNLRVAVTTSDIGLKYSPTAIERCAGADEGGRLAVEPCQSTDGECLVPCEGSSCLVVGDLTVPCQFSDPSQWIQVKTSGMDASLVSKAACRVVQGTGGCPVEQTLVSAIEALEKNPEFLLDSHLLIVIAASDEDDCSVENPWLFGTEAWSLETNLEDGLACHYPETNLQYLFEPADIAVRLTSFKPDETNGVVFAAITGVPLDASQCNGRGLSAEMCLSMSEMQLEFNGASLNAACVGAEGDVSATPGRRYVEVAEHFGNNGFVHSICDHSFSALTVFLEDAIRKAARFESCYGTYPLPVEAAPYQGCDDCIQSSCDLYVEIQVEEEQIEDAECPPALVGSREDYYDDITRSRSKQRLLCPVPKIRIPEGMSCQSAVGAFRGSRRVGWYYCESDTLLENTETACSDGRDNDGDDLVDCDDTADCIDCMRCGGVGCSLGCQMQEIVLTEAGRQAVGDYPLVLSCPY